MTTRRLAAILAADVVGYSRLIGADEAGTLARLRALRHEGRSAGSGQRWARLQDHRRLPVPASAPSIARSSNSCSRVCASLASPNNAHCLAAKNPGGCAGDEITLDKIIRSARVGI
jgi:hypothetical protein